MATSHFEILLKENSRDSRVYCNGEDISSHVSRVTVVQDAMNPPIVTITAAAGSAIVKIEGAMEPIILDHRLRDDQIDLLENQPASRRPFYATLTQFWVKCKHYFSDLWSTLRT